MLLQMLFGCCHELDARQFVSSILESADNWADETTLTIDQLLSFRVVVRDTDLNAIRLDRDEPEAG